MHWWDVRWWNTQRVSATATVAYTCVSVLLLLAILRQANISNKTLVLTQRPRLIIRNVVAKPFESSEQDPPMSHYFTVSRPVHGQFYVVNVGGSTAFIQESGGWVYWRQGPNLPMIRPYEGYDGNNVVSRIRLESGVPTVGLFQSDSTLSIENAKRILKGDTCIYVMGWVSYNDKLGIGRRTAFCRRWDHLLQRFVSVDNPDYEYAE